MVESEAERLARLEARHQEVDDFVFGSWDLPTHKRQPGIAERLDALTVQVETIIKILKWGIGPLVTVCTIASLNTSFKEILPEIVKVAASIISLH